MHEGARAHKECDLDDSVKDHMQKSRLKSLGCHEQYTEEHVGQVADRGKSETPLKVSLLDCKAGRIDKGENSECLGDFQAESSLQEIRSVGIPGQAHDGKYTGVDDRDGMQKGSDRCGRDRSRGQPAVQRENSRFHAETEKSEEEDQLHQSGIIGSVKIAPVEEIARAVIDTGHNNGKECERGSADRIGGVFSAGKRTLVIRIVSDQRNCDQGEQVIEHVQCRHVRRKGNAQSDPVGHHIEGKKAVAPPGVGHVFKGIQHDQGPHEGDHDRKKPCRFIRPQINGESSGKAVQGRTDNAHFPQTDPGQDTGDADHRHRIGIPDLSVLKAQRNDQIAAYDRHQNGNDQNQ